VKRHKLASSEFSHTGIIDAMVKTGKDLIISTGGVGDPDINWQLNYINSQAHQSFALCYLECVAQYPAKPELYDVSLLRGNTISARWARGISDHTIGSAVACAAVGAGATVIEKHFDPFPAEPPTPDSGFSANPTEFAMYVQDVREAASAVGDGIKSRRDQHEYALRWMRRYIVTQPIAAGEQFAYGTNFGIYRSLVDDTRGLSPITLPLWKLVEKRAKCALAPGETIGPGELA
jgi:pseudaminic acid synthase